MGSDSCMVMQYLHIPTSRIFYARCLTDVVSTLSSFSAEEFEELPCICQLLDEDYDRANKLLLEGVMKVVIFY